VKQYREEFSVLGDNATEPKGVAITSKFSGFSAVSVALGGPSAGATAA
jgi:hypothetical protein